MFYRENLLYQINVWLLYFLAEAEIIAAWLYE